MSDTQQPDGHDSSSSGVSPEMSSSSGEMSVSTTAAPQPAAPRRRWLPYAILVGVFLAGGATGAGVMRAQMQQQWQASFDRPGPKRGFRMKAMRRKLNLSAEQVERIEAIMREADERRDEAIGPCRDSLREAREGIHGRIREVLTPEQQPRFDRMLERRRNKPPRHRPRGRRGPKPRRRR